MRIVLGLQKDPSIYFLMKLVLSRYEVCNKENWFIVLRALCRFIARRTQLSVRGSVQ